MVNVRPSALAVALPQVSRIGRIFSRCELQDAYEIGLPEGTSTDPEELARCFFAHQAPWARMLMRLRDRMVAVFGIKTSRALEKDTAGGKRRVGPFRIYEKTSSEVLLGEDDKHLDFRVSVLREVRGTAHPQAAYLTVSTVVSCHNLLGRFYLFCIRPFHRMIVQSCFERAARAGWPSRP